MIFVITFARAIGRNWDGYSGHSTFGIREMRTSFIPPGKKDVSKADLINCVTEGPTILQQRLKKMGGRPSGPAALYVPISKIAS
jgi:hypothetical protein